MKIGALISRTGPAGLWGPSCEAGLLLAMAELNASGGVGERDVELVVADAGWTNAEAAAAAATLVDLDGVDAVVGMHPSNVRGAISRAIAGRLPYVYTPSYEGGENQRFVLATGTTDADILQPAVPWFIEHKRARRFYIIGNDYNWPREALQTATRVITRAGARVVGHTTLPVGCLDHQQALDEIVSAGPDVLIMMLLGMEAVRFNRAFAAAGLAGAILRFGMGMDETVLLSLGADATENLHGGSGYVPALRSSDNEAFLERYHSSFGMLAPPMNVFGWSCYQGIHLLGQKARAVRAPLRRDLAGVLLRAVAGVVPPSGPTSRSMHLCAADGVAWKVLTSYQLQA